MGCSGSKPDAAGGTATARAEEGHEEVVFANIATAVAPSAAGPGEVYSGHLTDSVIEKAASGAITELDLAGRRVTDAQCAELVEKLKTPPARVSKLR